MTENVIPQIQALRDKLAEELSRDPRVLTLQALDKSLAEIHAILGTTAATAPAGSLLSRLNVLSPGRPRPLSVVPTEGRASGE